MSPIQAATLLFIEGTEDEQEQLEAAECLVQSGYCRTCPGREAAAVYAILDNLS